MAGEPAQPANVGDDIVGRERLEERAEADDCAQRRLALISRGVRHDNRNGVVGARRRQGLCRRPRSSAQSASGPHAELRERRPVPESEPGGQHAAVGIGLDEERRTARPSPRRRQRHRQRRGPGPRAPIRRRRGSCRPRDERPVPAPWRPPPMPRARRRRRGRGATRSRCPSRSSSGRTSKTVAA